MCVGTCMSIQTCACVWVLACRFKRVRACACLHVDSNVCACACVWVPACRFKRVCACACLHVDSNVCACTCVWVLACRFKRVRACACVCLPSVSSRSFTSIFRMEYFSFSLYSGVGPVNECLVFCKSGLRVRQLHSSLSNSKFLSSTTDNREVCVVIEFHFV